MVRGDGERNFVFREEDGTETGVFSGNVPRQAALEAVRRLDPAGPGNDTKSDTVEIRLRGKGTDKAHIFDAWTWNSSAPKDRPGWMEREITKGSVSRKRIKHLDK